MRPTEILMQEHRVIEQVLDCLEVIAQRAEEGEPLDTESVNQSLDFFRNFADKCHHGKEEACLFPLLEEKGFSREQGPTGVMLHEHEEGRTQVQGMAQASAAIAAGDLEAQATFLVHAREFITLLRNHIQKEDHCLFQMTNQALDETDQLRLMQAFAEVEHDDMGPGTHEKYLDVAMTLAKRYAVQRRNSATFTGQGCGGHH